MLRILAWLLSLLSGVGRCLVPAKLRRQKVEGGNSGTGLDSPSISVGSASSIAAGSAVGVVQVAPDCDDRSVCFVPQQAAQDGAPTPCSYPKLSRVSASRQPAAATPVAPRPVATPVAPPAATPLAPFPAATPVPLHGKHIPTPASVSVSIASYCPSPSDGDFVTPQQQPFSAFNPRYIINTEKQVVGYANTGRRFQLDRPLQPDVTPYLVRLDKELEKEDKFQKRLKGRENEAPQ